MWKKAAIAAHGDQKYGKLPYWRHLQDVEEVLADYGFTSVEYQAAAWLHDTVEDTATSIDDIFNHFGPEVSKLVWAVTGVGHNRKTRQASILKKLHNTKAACPLKLADRIANLESAIKEGNSSGKFAMYHKENEAFEKVVRKHVPEEMWNRLERAFDYAEQKGWI